MAAIGGVGELLTPCVCCCGQLSFVLVKLPCVCCCPVQIVMSPHEQAEEFIASYTKLMQGDTDTTNFQKVLEMKVNTHTHSPSPLLYSHMHTCHTLPHLHYTHISTRVGSETQ